MKIWMPEWLARLLISKELLNDLRQRAKLTGTASKEVKFRFSILGLTVSGGVTNKLKLLKDNTSDQDQMDR